MSPFHVEGEGGLDEDGTVDKCGRSADRDVMRRRRSRRGTSATSVRYREGAEDGGEESDGVIEGTVLACP